MNDNTTRKVSILANPVPIVVISVAGIISSIFVLAHATPRDLSIALWTGLGIGLPEFMLAKWFMRRYKHFYAEYYTSPWEQRSSWQMQKTNLLCGCSPVLLAMWMSIGLEHYNLLGYGGVPIILTLGILIYPEQKAIYEAAKARLQEAERQ
ncbi:MAG TPA: hypothetical protein VFI02_22460 [Armatimonadota bacterium]|nr:hypothetical protein [Armatimonadota bacterium]